MTVLDYSHQWTGLDIFADHLHNNDIVYDYVEIDPKAAYIGRTEVAQELTPGELQMS